MYDSAFLFICLIAAVFTVLFIGIFLENNGFFKIPEDQVINRYLKLERIRNKRKKSLNAK